jgi:hypothetical protein
MATLTSRIKLADFHGLSEVETQQRVGQLVCGSVSPSPELLEEQQNNLAQRIGRFEQQYQMTSSQMRRALETAVLKESADICSWLMLLEIKEGFGQAI